MQKTQDYLLSICQEGIVLSKGDHVWFFCWYDLEKYNDIEEFLEVIG